MSILQTPQPTAVSDAPFSARHPWWRVLVLCLLLLFSFALYVILIGAAPKSDNVITPFLHVWMLCFLPYFAACAFVLATKPALGRWRWLELGIILAGALIFRIMLLPLPPNLSRDSWRYLWDARALLHGYSPYVYAPGDKVLQPLRDNLIYANSRYRNVPTLYPPGAQAVYLLSYLLAPSNLYFLKGLFVVFDMVTCGALALLLRRKGLDPRRAIIYAWCPLPIVEFAIQGHVDVITLTFSILAMLSATNTRQGGRVLTGILIGLAALTKIYPILLLVVVVRRREYALVISCFAVIILGYLPFLIMGHGQAFGYFAGYASEQGQNGGVIQLLVRWLGDRQHIPLTTTIALEHIVDLVVISVVSLVVLVQRLRERISLEAAALLLFGAVLSISSHVFPWYTTALLLWVPLLLMGGKMSIAAPGEPSLGKTPITRASLSLWITLVYTNLAILAVWYFTCASILGYFFSTARDWTVYYWLVYDPVMIALGAAAIIGIIHLFAFQKGTHLAKRHTTISQ